MSKGVSKSSADWCSDEIKRCLVPSSIEVIMGVGRVASIGVGMAIGMTICLAVAIGLRMSISVSLAIVLDMAVNCGMTIRLVVVFAQVVSIGLGFAI